VFEVASRCGDTLTGEDVLELKYLDQVISETLRLLPPPATVRTCTKEWRVPDTDIVVPVGMRVHIPIIGIHVNYNHTHYAPLATFVQN
jgi:cytochrome P450 family 6